MTDDIVTPPPMAINHIAMQNTPTEFALSVGMVAPRFGPMAGESADAAVLWYATLILSPGKAKQLHAILGEQIDTWERANGEVRLNTAAIYRGDGSTLAGDNVRAFAPVPTPRNSYEHAVAESERVRLAGLARQADYRPQDYRQVDFNKWFCADCQDDHPSGQPCPAVAIKDATCLRCYVDHEPQDCPHAAATQVQNSASSSNSASDTSGAAVTLPDVLATLTPPSSDPSA